MALQSGKMCIRDSPNALEIRMPANFLSVVYAVFAAAIAIALLVTLVIFGATIFAVAFVYIFIP